MTTKPASQVTVEALYAKIARLRLALYDAASKLRLHGALSEAVEVEMAAQREGERREGER